MDTPVVSSVGASFVEVGRDDIGLGHSGGWPPAAAKVDAAGSRAGAGEAGGVQTVEVDGEIHRHLVVAELGRQLGKAGKIELVSRCAGLQTRTCAVAAADAELVDMAVAHQLVVVAAQYAGVAELCAQGSRPAGRRGRQSGRCRSGYFFTAARTAPRVTRCSPPSSSGNLPSLIRRRGPCRPERFMEPKHSSRSPLSAMSKSVRSAFCRAVGPSP